MMKRIIDAAITDAAMIVSSEFVDPGKNKHRARFDALLTQANPTRPPVQALVGTSAHGTVTVTPDQMSKLEQAEQIAMVTKMLLTPGNQKQIVKQTGGLSYLRTAYAHHFNRTQSPAQLAATAIIAGGGNCTEHAYVAFEIAKSLNIPVARYADRNVDHAYVALYPDSAEPIMIDPWTDFPTICQKQEYALDDPCNLNKLQAKYIPSGVVDHSFNLDAIMLTKEMVTSQLGVNGVDNALKEDARKAYGISSKALDKLMLSQGVNNYDAINIENLSETEKAEFIRKQNKVNAKLEKKLKKFLERGCLRYGYPQVSKTSVVVGATGGANPADFEAAYLAAQQKAEYDAEKIASDQALVNAETSASKKTVPKSTKTATFSWTAIAIAGDAKVSIETTATATVSVKPAIWNAQTNAKTHSYKTPNGVRREFNRAPAGHYDDLISAKEKKFPIFTKFDVFKAKIGYPAGTFKQLKKVGSEVINTILSKPSSPPPFELQSRVDQEMQAVTQQLQHINSTDTQTLAEVQKRINDVSPLIRDQALISLSATLPRLAGDNLERGTQILRQWLKHSSTTENHMEVIEKLVAGWKDSFCNDPNVSKEKAIRNVLARYTKPSYVAWQATELLSSSHSSATQTKAIRFIVDQLYRIDTAVELNTTMSAINNQLQALPNENLKEILEAINAMPPRIGTSNAHTYVYKLTDWLKLKQNTGVLP